VTLLRPNRRDAAQCAARLWAYWLPVLMECRAPPVPGPRTNLLLRSWRLAIDTWPFSHSGNISLPSEDRFLRWLLGDEERGRRSRRYASTRHWHWWCVLQIRCRLREGHDLRRSSSYGQDHCV